MVQRIPVQPPRHTSLGVVLTGWPEEISVAVTWASARRRARAATALAGVCLATGAGASVLAACGSSRPRRHTSETASAEGLAVFAHPLVGRYQPPAVKVPHGAVLADVSGENWAYVSRQYVAQSYSNLTQGAYLCLTDVEAGGLSGTVCGPTEKVERYGILAVHLSHARVRIGMLLPNGVRSATIVDHDGIERVVPVLNNVVESEDRSPVAVQYVLADGHVHRESIPASFIAPPPRRQAGR